MLWAFAGRLVCGRVFSELFPVAKPRLGRATHLELPWMENFIVFCSCLEQPGGRREGFGARWPASQAGRRASTPRLIGTAFSPSGVSTGPEKGGGVDAASQPTAQTVFFFFFFFF